MLQVSGKRTPCKTLTQKNDQLALKNIVDPFLTWYNLQFDKCLEEIKKYPDYVSIIEESFSDDGGFEVNEQTLYNILSADLQGGSKVQSAHTYRTLPTIPQSIANATNLRQKTYAHKLNENLLSSNKKNILNDGTLLKHKHHQFVPEDFVDTEELCRNMSHLRIVEQYFKTTSRS